LSNLVPAEYVQSIH